MSQETATFFAFTRPLEIGGHTRLVNRTTLHLMKALRARGARVIVEPDDGTPIHYIVQKGEPTLLADPTFAFFVGIPAGIIVNLFSNWLYDSLRQRDSQSEQGSCIVIRIDEPEGAAFYSHTGARVSQNHADRVIELLKASAETITALRLARAAGDGKMPLCVEHTSQIVGWGEVEEDLRGLRMTTEIEDDVTWQRLKSGELRGASIAGIVTRSECSICHGDYAECPHISGVTYEGEVCVNTIRRIDVSEISLVKEPINEDCLIDLTIRSNRFHDS